jgi:hypothetical protein
MRIAYWRNKSVCVLRQDAANCKKSPRNTNWKLKTLQYCCALPNGAKGIALRQYNGGDSNVPYLVLDSLRRQNTKPFLQSSLVYLGWEGVREGVPIPTRGQSQLYSSYICSLYSFSFIFSYIVCIYRIGPNTMTQQIKLIQKKNAASNSPRFTYSVGHCLLILLYWGGSGNR